MLTIKSKLFVVSLFVSSLFSITLFSSCNDEKDAEPDTEIETVQDTITTFILVRHAEKNTVGLNPDLNVLGKKRAQDLVEFLKDTDLKAIFSTAYNRTMQTATPVAEDHNLDVIQYNPAKLDSLASANKIKYKGETILVVGHSNTTPELLNILLDSNRYSNIPEDVYDNIYTFTIDQNGKKKVLEQKYGD